MCLVGRVIGFEISFSLSTAFYWRIDRQSDFQDVLGLLDFLFGPSDGPNSAALTGRTGEKLDQIHQPCEKGGGVQMLSVSLLPSTGR